MSPILSNFSIVVAVDSCNPTILNPDFLVKCGIVPSDWKVADSPITIPSMSSVSYMNGTQVTVESTKIQVMEQPLPNKAIDPTASNIQDIAQKYIETLPHDRYQAVGHNFTAFVERTNPSAFLKDRFLKPGAWDSDVHTMAGFALKLTYPVDGGELHLTIGSAPLTTKGGATKTGISITANYHRPCSGYPADKQVIGHISQVETDWDKLQLILGDVI